VLEDGRVAGVVSLRDIVRTRIWRAGSQ
jgi:hypothetical protein